MFFALFVTFATILGLLIGSFLNVVIFRVPNEIPVSKGRSFCPVCKEKIAWYDNIPLFSFLFLRAKCRHCKTTISWIYPTVEFLTAACFFLIAFFVGDKGIWDGNDGVLWKNIFKCCLLMVVTASLVSLAFIDFNTFEIPDRFILINLVASCFFFFFDDIIWYERLIGLVVVSVPMLLLSLATRGGIGGGDIKLMFSVGLILGWKGSLIATAIGYITGAIVAIILLIKKKKTGKSEIAFGPFLAFGIFVCFICLSNILELFTGLMW